MAKKQAIHFRVNSRRDAKVAEFPIKDAPFLAREVATFETLSNRCAHAALLIRLGLALIPRRTAASRALPRIALVLPAKRSTTTPGGMPWDMAHSEIVMPWPLRKSRAFFKSARSCALRFSGVCFMSA